MGSFIFSFVLTGLSVLPILGAAGAYILPGNRENRAPLLTMSATTGSFVLALTLSLWHFSGPGKIVLFPHAFPDSIGPFFSLAWDPLAAIMTYLILSVSLTVQAFSRRYMVGEPLYGLFFAGLSLATGFLLLLVTARHLLLLYTAWELVLVALCLLLIHHRTRRESAIPATRTWVFNQAGGLFLLVGILILGHAFRTFDLDGIFDVLRTGSLPFPYLTVVGHRFSVLDVATFFIGLGILARSAQFPFHLWLPGTLDAPTSVSALMHAGIVNAGGFMLNRLAPIFLQTPDILHGLFLVGALTAILGSAIMLVQSHVKQTLVYSTMGQMGYMIAECGLGVFPAAIFHMIAHGIFKATLFLGSGGVIHAERSHEHTAHTPFLRSFRKYRLLWIGGVSFLLALPLILLLSDTLRGQPFLPGKGGLILLFFGIATAMQTVFNLFRFSHLLTPKAIALFTTTFSFILGLYWIGLHLFDRMLTPLTRIAPIMTAAPSHGWGFFFYPIALATMGFILIAGWLFLSIEVGHPKASRAAGFTTMDRLHDFLVQGAYCELVLRRYLLEPFGKLATALRKIHEHPVRPNGRPVERERGIHD
jgi:NADH-quinone oxidoreductase subunit L